MLIDCVAVKTTPKVVSNSSFGHDIQSLQGHRQCFGSFGRGFPLSIHVTKQEIKSNGSREFGRGSKTFVFFIILRSNAGISFFEH